MPKAVKSLADFVAVICGVITSVYLLSSLVADPFEKGLVVGGTMCAVISYMIYLLYTHRNSVRRQGRRFKARS